MADTFLLAHLCRLAGKMLRICVTPASMLVAGTAMGALLPMDSLVRWILAAALVLATTSWFVLSMPVELAQRMRAIRFLRAIPFGARTR
jgi:hypothetical protein